MNRTLKWTLIILGVLILTGGIAFAVYESIKGPTEIAPDLYSITRMQQISRVFTSYLGPKWPYVLIAFGILLFIILLLVYLATRKGIDVNISNENFIKLNRTFLWLAIAISIGVLSLGVYAYVVYAKERNESRTTSGDFADTTKMTQFLEIIGVCVLLAIIVVIAVMFAVKQFKR